MKLFGITEEIDGVEQTRQMTKWEITKEVAPILIHVVIVVISIVFFKKITITYDEAQNNLRNLLDANLTEYTIVDKQGKEYNSNNIDFTEFYVVSDDTLYKCEYTISSDELYMYKLTDAPIILEGKANEL